MAYDPGVWKDFYIMTGGAAAALTGLLFVAMSMHSSVIMSRPFYRNRAVGTLMLLTAQLLIAGAVLMPGQPLKILSCEVEIGFLLFLALAINAARNPPPRSISKIRRGAEIFAQVVWLAFFFASGVSLFVQHGGGFYWLAFVMIGAFAWNVYVEWVLITEFQREGEGQKGTS